MQATTERGEDKVEVAAHFVTQDDPSDVPLLAPTTTPPKPLTKADKALAAAKWEPIDWSGHLKPGVGPYATHTAVVENRGMNWRCYQLSDGRRVIGRRERFVLPGDAGTMGAQ